MTRNGALAGMVVGALTVIFWKQTGSALYEMVPGFLAARWRSWSPACSIACPPTDVQVDPRAGPRRSWRADRVLIRGGAFDRPGMTAR